MQVVRAEDEWCAEAYMETDYSALTQAGFEETVRKYAMFRLLGVCDGSAMEDSSANGG
jgi:hypothetical protein